MRPTGSCSHRVTVLVLAAVVVLLAPGAAYGAVGFLREDLTVGLAPTAAAVSDFNADGDRDLAVVNQFDNTVSVLLGAAGNTFAAPTTYPVGNGPYALAVGEFNGDGDPDLAVVNNYAVSVTVLLGAAGGTFAPQPAFATALSNPFAVAVGDFDQDGDSDLAVTAVDPDTADGVVAVHLGDGGGIVRRRDHVPDRPVRVRCGGGRI